MVKTLIDKTPPPKTKCPHCGSLNTDKYYLKNCTETLDSAIFCYACGKPTFFK